MKINATEQTSTFPCPVDKLKGQLMDNIGMKWKTEFGQFEITKENINWIIQNVKTSMYNNQRCYIYNKAFYEAFYNPKHNPDKEACVTNNLDCERFDLIRTWAAERGIYEGGNLSLIHI